MQMTRAQAAAVLCGAAGFGAAAPARAQATIPLRTINPPIEGAAQAVYAKEMGFFAKAGFEVSIQIMQAGVPAAVASNSFEFGWVTADALANAHARSIPLVAIAPAQEFVYTANARTNTGLCVAPSSAIRTAKDLNGKVIAVPSRLGISENCTRAWIDKNGGDSTTIKMVEVPFIAMAAALESGRIDCAYVTEPFLTANAKVERSIGDPQTSIGPRYLTSVWATTAPYAAAHPDIVSRYAAVMRETAIWANNNPEKSGAIVASFTKLDPATVASMVRSRFADQLSPGLLQPVIDVSAKYNHFTPFSASELIYTPPR
jgi:NitT/TauT family transport system substrate-binding protein